jgi:hypothetical protein
MMRFILLILLSVLSCSVFAADEQAPAATTPAAAPVKDVPQITYAQKVEVVVDAKHNPMILDLHIDQEKDGVSLIAIVDKDVDHEVAKKIASDLVMLTKSMTLDDRPTDIKEPGKGLYNYGVKIIRTDQVVLLTARKMAADADLKIDPPMMEDLAPEIRPLTRADGKP